jgi:hypothetical protein
LTNVFVQLFERVELLVKVVRELGGFVMVQGQQAAGEVQISELS